MRELRTELHLSGNKLRQQLANEEVLPSERAALLERQIEIREQEAQVCYAIWEMYVAEPSRFLEVAGAESATLPEVSPIL